MRLSKQQNELKVKLKDLIKQRLIFPAWVFLDMTRRIVRYIKWNPYLIKSLLCMYIKLHNICKTTLKKIFIHLSFLLHVHVWNALQFLFLNRCNINRAGANQFDWSILDSPYRVSHRTVDHKVQGSNPSPALILDLRYQQVIVDSSEVFHKIEDQL